MAHADNHDSHRPRPQIYCRIMHRFRMHLLVVTALIAGCGPSGRERELTSRDPIERSRGAIGVANSDDASSLHRLVNLLEDDDPGVRLYAILALRKMTGQDYGYRYYQREIEREAAVARWREALRTGTVQTRRTEAATAREQSAAASETQSPEETGEGTD